MATPKKVAVKSTIKTVTKKIATVKSPVVAKKSIKPVWQTSSKTIEVQTIDWAKLPTGSRVKGVYNKKPFNGLVYNYPKGKVLWICQDVYDGSAAPNRLGFKKSYGIWYDRDSNPMSNVIEHQLWFEEPAPDFVPPKIWSKGEVAGYTPEFKSGGVKFGCKTVSNKTILELVEYLID